MLLDWLREKGCLSVKRGCDTSNCGLCTVFMDNKPILSCSKLAVQADGHEIKTLEGLQEEALEFVGLSQTGSRPVWFLQSRFCYEYNCTSSRKSRSNG